MDVQIRKVFSLKFLVSIRREVVNDDREGSILSNVQMIDGKFIFHPGILHVTFRRTHHAGLDRLGLGLQTLKFLLCRRGCLRSSLHQLPRQPRIGVIKAMIIKPAINAQLCSVTVKIMELH